MHCRNIFTGPNARVRKVKKVRKLLEKNQHSFATLTNEYNLETICNVAKELLDAGIFNSNSEAEMHFPGLFPSPNRGWEESESSDFDATRSEVEAMEDVILSEKESIKTSHGPSPKPSSCGKNDLSTQGSRVVLS